MQTNSPTTPTAHSNFSSLVSYILPNTIADTNDSFVPSSAAATLLSGCEAGELLQPVHSAHVESELISGLPL